MGEVELFDDYLRISIDGQRADFHLRWLRHNCDVDRHPLTGERTLDSAELPDRLGVSEAVLDVDVLRVRWTNDQRTSRYPISWLREHAYASGREAVPPPSNDTSTLEILGGAGPHAIADELIARVLRDGAVIVRRDHPAPETETETWIAALEQRGLRTIATHFGRIEDLRTDNVTNANTDQLGYTDARIQLHTDQPFLV